VSNLSAGPVPAYATSNARVAWRPRADVELALTGNNLHQAHHLEWPTGGGPNVLIERTVFAGVTLRR
jgi:hypothetical protein